jgi:signal transduction histidine kinase
MTYFLLNTSSEFLLSSILIWTSLFLLLAALIGLLLWQIRVGKELKSELKQLDKVQKNDIAYEFVLKSMRLSTWYIDAKTRQIVFQNDFRSKSDTYVPPTEGTTKDLGATMSEQDRMRLNKTLDDLFSGRQEEAHLEYQVRIPHTKNTYWSESYAIVSERDVDGNPTRIVGTSQRIDDRKALEKALVDARNRAEESDRLKTAFIANMSHEIRTPLNAIVGFTSILPDVPDPAERQQLLDLIHENTQKLLRIVDDVVNISKVEAGKEELVMTSFNLSAMLNELVEHYSKQAKEGVVLNTMFASDSLTITTDHNRLLETMRHLLSNAVKFTDHGMVVIGFDAPVDGRISIWVRDTGIGIAPDMQERIFERFFKVDEFVPGAGLGLSICRTMTYSMGGSVRCESELGKGSTFTVEIPIE